jgi:anti-anti-sigma factor
VHPHWHREIVLAMRAGYRRASVEQRRLILDDLCEVTGYHRKYLIELLNERPAMRAAGRRGRPPSTGVEAVRLVASVWIAMGCPWSRRLRQALPLWLARARREYDISAELEAQVLGMSERTIDRRLAPYREQLARWPEELRRRIGRGEAKSRIFYGAGAERRPRQTLVLRLQPGPEAPTGPRSDGRSLSVGGESAKMAASASRTQRRVSMNIKTRNQRDVVMVTVSGSMVRQEQAFPVMKQVLKLVGQKKKFVIDLGKVDKIDSAGVGELVAINVALKEKGGELRLANLDERVGKVLQMALIPKIIPTYPTPEEAVASFKPVAAAAPAPIEVSP